ncbi:MAG: alpha/beta hydrolase [Parvibaculum sp.]|nr:alpha/beta hydrolase [Parvibaculum sp.]
MEQLNNLASSFKTRRFRIPMGLAALIVAGSVIFYWGAPNSLLTVTQAAQRAGAGLSKEVVDVNGAPVTYLKGGDGEAVILLHGIYAEKDHWDQVAGQLTDDFLVIAPDIPGFGESGMPEGGSYSYDQQVGRLHDFLRALKLSRYHLVGNSMGGAIAGAMAARWPEETLSLSFFGGAPRVPGAKPGDMERIIASGGPSPMVVTSEAEYFQRFDFIFHEMPFIPTPILNLWAARDAADPEKNRRIWHEVGNEHAADFPNSIPRISTPTLILWGDMDRVFDVSGASALQKQIQHSQIHILEETGHLPMLERPSESGAFLRRFLLEHKQKSTADPKAGVSSRAGSDPSANFLSGF